MRCKIISDYQMEIKRYCEDNDLSFRKITYSSLSWNDKSVWVCGPGDPARGKLGLLDDIPLPIALEIYLENGKLRFVQTDITHKYLGVDRETKKPVAAKKPTSRELAYA